MKFLIVDDSKAMRSIVIRTLRQAGYGEHTMEEAVNGLEALKAIEASPPDVVLCDWNMPEMSGIELLHALREKGSSVKCGLVTSEGSPEMKQQATDAGALFVVTKPFTVESFKEALGPMMA